MALVSEQYEESGKEHLLYCYRQDLDERWLSYSMECYCHQRNVQDLFADGKTPYEGRFGESFKGSVIPLGWLNITQYRHVIL